MLDPFTALSLAGIIVQFVDFSSKIISESVKIYKAGSPVETKELEVITNDLVSLSANIQQSVRPGLGPATWLTDDDARLEALAQASSVVALELIEALKKLKVNTRSRTLNSVGQALKTAMGKDKINEIALRLASFREELQLRILVSLRASVDVANIHNDTRFNHVDNELKAVMDDILSGKLEILDRIDERTAIITARQEQSDLLSIQHHERVMAAITALAMTTDTPYNVRPENMTAHAVPPKIAAAAKRSVLVQMAFRGMRDREERVNREYDRTFEWALHDLSDPTRPGTTLIDWLRSGDGCYWVNGKAASGKSTLMKFLTRRPECHTALKQWAGADQLFVDSFFFWNIGTTLQKSQLGLFRSLLYSILHQYPDMIPLVLHGYYTEWTLAHAHLPNAGSSSEVVGPISENEIKTAFLRTMEYLPDAVKICIFIDGIDEYDGDHSEISAMLTSVARGNLKMVLSSRPIRACQVAFEGLPSLRVQDLSRGDIELYINSQIKNHERMQHLRLEEPQKADNLVDEIVSKASGVFLWVMLVVKSLLQGLDNSDRVDDLRRRLEKFPPELEDLYRHMIDRMDPLYRQQASKYLQIVLRSTEVTQFGALNLLKMSFADDPHASTERQPRKSTLSVDNVKAKAKAMDARLVSRCFGLIEAEGIEPRSRVSFLHKSVVDFLRQPDVWIYMVELTDSLDFDANQSLLNSCLEFVKAVRAVDYSKDVPVRRERDIHNVIDDFVTYCLLFEQSSGKSYTMYYDDMAGIIGTLLPALNVGPSTSRPFDAVSRLCWLFDLEMQPRDKCFRGHLPELLLPAVLGLATYLDEKLDRSRSLDEINPDLLIEVIGPENFRSAYHRQSLQAFEESIGCLLSYGADPNRVWRNISSPWVRLLLCLEHFWDDASIDSLRMMGISTRFDNYHSALGADRFVESYVRVFLLFVKHGADPTLALHGEIFCKRAGRIELLYTTRTVLAVVQDYRRHFGGDGKRKTAQSSSPFALWDELEEALIQKGAKAQRWCNNKLVTDGNLATSSKPGFLQTTLKKLKPYKSGPPLEAHGSRVWMDERPTILIMNATEW